VAAACSEPRQSTFADDSFAIVVNADIGTGLERLLVRVTQLDGSRLGSSEQPIDLEVTPLDGPDNTQRAAGVFIDIIPGVTGLYRATFDFDRPGLWEVTVIPEHGDRLEPALFNVLNHTLAPAVGQQAPKAPTPTLDDLPIEALTTDPNPDLGFYEISLEEALSNGRKTVLVFSTPGYCLTATCGPLLDNVKEIAPAYPDVDFIHVEVYTGLQDPDFVPDTTHLAPAVTTGYWNLPSEPWVFVIDGDGIIMARFEGVLDPNELIPHIAS
jgi:hypothetical protein